MWSADFSSGGGSGMTTTSGEGTAIITDSEQSDELVQAAEETGNTNSGDFISDPSGDFSAENVESGGDNALGANVTGPAPDTSGGSDSGGQEEDPSDANFADEPVAEMGSTLSGSLDGMDTQTKVLAGIALLGIGYVATREE